LAERGGRLVRDVAARILLRNSPLFRGLPPGTLDRIESLATRRAYAKDQVIFHQGDRGDALFGVSTGRVLIAANGPDGKQISLNIMEPGDVFGEIALLDNGLRTASAVALAPSQLVVIRRGAFQSLVGREPAMALQLLQLLCRRLRWTTDLIEESALLAVPAQIARRLDTLARISGKRGVAGLELAISQAELGQFLGLSRQSVNLHLKQMQRDGVVKLARSRILIANLRALQALARKSSS
jgi:CRP/FNR family transcriptional regulator, cyclic AMP receptor protein